MCITSETRRANSVIKTALNNLHQAGPNKTHMHGNTKIKPYADLIFTVLNTICSEIQPSAPEDGHNETRNKLS